MANQPEQVVNLLRQIEVAVASEKLTATSKGCGSELRDKCATLIPHWYKTSGKPAVVRQRAAA